MKQLAFLLVLLAIAVVSGCSGDSGPTNDVVMAPNTKVLDDAARAAVSSYDPNTGVITFGRAAPFTDALAVGDIVASKTNPPAAPVGFLRKVTGIDRSGGAVVLATQQAGLGEALQVAHIRQVGKLVAPDPSNVGPLPPGVSLVSANAVGPGQVHIDHIPDGHGTHIHLDHYQLAVNAGPVSGNVELDGDVAFDGGFNFNLNLDFLGVHHFLAEVELDVDTSLTVSGHIEAGFDARSPAIADSFPPIDIQIGPFPLVLVPSVDMKIGVSGSVAFDVSFHEVQSSTVTVGTRYDDGVGWQDLTGTHGDGGIDRPPTVSFSVDVEAYARVEASILAYGIVGPYFFAQEGFEVNAKVPRRPCLQAGIHLQLGAGVKATLFGFVDLADFSFTALDDFVPVFQSPDVAPFVTITSPIDDGGHFLGHDPIHFQAAILDLQDGIDDESRVHATWTSDGSVLGYGSDFQRPVPLATPGPHTVTVTVIDSIGLSATATRVVTIDQVDAHAYIDSPATGTTVTAGSAYHFVGHVDDPNVPTADVCPYLGYRITWATDNAGDMITAPNGCPTTNMVFVGTTPTRTVTMTAVGPYGETSTSSITLNVVLPPPGVLTFSNPAVDAEIDATDAILSMPIHFTLSNPPAGSVTYTWSATSYLASGAVYHSGTLGSTGVPIFDWANPTGDGFIDITSAETGRSQPQHSGQNIRVFVHAVDGGGLTYDGYVDIWFLDVLG